MICEYSIRLISFPDQGDRVDTAALRTFVVAARAGNFRRAAGRLFIAQATVSQHIHRLEAELGCPLFHRHGRRVELNAAGRAFLVRAERILLESEGAAAELRALASEGPGELRIAASPYLGRTLLPGLLARYARQGGAWAIAIRPSTEVPELILSGRADIALSREAPSSPLIRVERLHEDPFVLVAPQDGLDMDRELPPWDALLATHPLLTHGPGAPWVQVRAIAGERGVPVRTMDVSQVDVARRCVEEGLGVSFLPLSAVQEGIRLGFLLRVPTPGLALPADATYLLTPEHPARQATAFAAFVRRRLGST